MSYLISTKGVFRIIFLILKLSILSLFFYSLLIDWSDRDDALTDSFLQHPRIWRFIFFSAILFYWKIEWNWKCHWTKRRTNEVIYWRVMTTLLQHCAFSSNLFHGQIVQIAILQPSDPRNKKCSPWKVFGRKIPSNPATFEQERP